jgi:hypothetical protein
LFPFGDDNCHPGFPPPICYPQIDTAENPRPPEKYHHHRPEGMGTLELRGLDALAAEQGNNEGVFGKESGGRGGDGSGGTDGES